MSYSQQQQPPLPPYQAAPYPPPAAEMHNPAGKGYQGTDYAPPPPPYPSQSVPPYPAAQPPAQDRYPPVQDPYPPVEQHSGFSQQGQYDAEEASWRDDVGFAGSSFSDKAVRRAFIQKVYMILMVQLLVTCAFIAFFLFHKPTQLWVKSHSGIYWAAYAVFFVSYFALICCPTLRRETPWNFIALSVFTLAFTYMAAMISSFYNIESVLVALGITAGVCLGLTVFAMQTKIDFTLCSGLLFALIWTLFLFGLVTIIVGSATNFGKSFVVMNYVYGGLGALVFSLFLVFDTQMIVGGHRLELDPEEYVFGALQLYMDVVYLFLFILQLIGGGSRS